MIVYAYDDQKGLEDLELSLAQILNEKLAFRGFTDAELFWKCAQLEEYDAAFVNLEINKRAGMLLFGKLKSNYPTRGFIGMASKERYSDSLTLLKYHADDYLLKPFDIDRLRESISTLHTPLEHIPEADAYLYGGSIIGGTHMEQNQVVPEEELLREEEEAEDKKRKKIKHRSPMNPIHVFFIHALLIVLILWLMFGFICGLASAPNNDMAPAIKTSDLLMYYRLENKMKAQDVVVLEKNDTRYVGRIVAVEGDTVEVSDKETLIINGKTMNESNIYTPTPNYEGFVKYPVKLGKGEFFVLSDYRNGGEDSRYYGVVKKKDILGTVITVVRRNNI